MSKVILDDVLRAKLNGLNEQVEICDETGRTVGHFVPADFFKELLYTWANAQVTDEELEQARRQTGGRPLAEIWKRLGNA
jgi:hypothetical protein